MTPDTMNFNGQTPGPPRSSHPSERSVAILMFFRIPRERPLLNAYGSGGTRVLCRLQRTSIGVSQQPMRPLGSGCSLIHPARNFSDDTPGREPGCKHTDFVYPARNRKSTIVPKGAVAHLRNRPGRHDRSHLEQARAFHLCSIHERGPGGPRRQTRHRNVPICDHFGYALTEGTYAFVA